MENLTLDDNDKNITQLTIPSGSIFGPGGLVDTLSRQEHENQEERKQKQQQEQLHLKFDSQETVQLVERKCSFRKSLTSTTKEEWFTNDFILRKIFNYLPLTDLKSCRLINLQWNNEATKHLQKKFTLQPIHISSTLVKLQPNANSKTSKTNSKSTPSLPLSEFINLIENSTFFPCNNFSVESLNLLLFNTEILSFFQAFGFLVKQLEVEGSVKMEKSCGSQSSSSSSPQILLCQLLPFLETLVFDHNPEYFFLSRKSSLQNPTLSFEYTGKLTKLKTAILPDYRLSSEFLSNLLEIAPNLENIYWANYDSGCTGVKGLRVFLDLNAIPLLKTLYFLFHANTIDIYEEILQEGPSLWEINQIEFGHKLTPETLPRIGKFLSKLLRYGEKSLQKLLNVYPMGHIPELAFPVLKNVSRLHCKYCESTLFTPPLAVPMFPPGVDMATIFPNLRRVQFEFQNCDLDTLKPADVFRESGSGGVSLATVEVLSVCMNAHLPTVWVEYFCGLFPCVKEAELSVLDFSTAGEYIWRLRSLETLDLQIYVEIDDTEEVFVEMDSGFTGFSKESVRDLYEREGEGLSLEDNEVEALRTKCSIVDLKNLQFLSLHFDEKMRHYYYDGQMDYINNVTYDATECGHCVKVEDNVVLSHLTEIFGFRMCPKLKNNICMEYIDSCGYVHGITTGW